MNDDWKDIVAGGAVAAAILSVWAVISLILIHLPRSH